MRDLLAADELQNLKNLKNLEVLENLESRRQRLPATPKETDRSEGDVNRSSYRTIWQENHLSPATRELLDADARLFLRQSLSSPCLNTIVGCEGIHLIDSGAAFSFRTFS